MKPRTTSGAKSTRSIGGVAILYDVWAIRVVFLFALIFEILDSGIARLEAVLLLLIGSVSGLLIGVTRTK